MKRGNWIAIDKRVGSLLPKDNRSFTVLEALVSYSIDQDNLNKGSINGYASLWNWSRDRVRRFVRGMETGEDYYQTGNHTSRKQAIRYIFKDLQDKQNRKSYKQSYGTYDNIIKKEYCRKSTLSNTVVMSFKNYVKENQKILDKVKTEIIAYFLDVYEKSRGDQHPYLKPDQWQKSINEILTFKVKDKETQVEPDTIRKIINLYFQKDYTKLCNYHLPHFLSHGIKSNLYYEVMRKKEGV